MIEKRIKKLLESENKYCNKNKQWTESAKYFNVLKFSTTGIGNFGEDIIEEYCIENKILYNRPTLNKHLDYDITINNKKVEIKTAYLDSRSKFQFNGINPSKKENIDEIIFVAIFPNEIRILYKNFDDFLTDKNTVLTAMNKNCINSYKFTPKKNLLSKFIAINEFLLEKS